MAEYYLLLSPCNCIAPTQTDSVNLLVKDSNKITDHLYIWGIAFDGVYVEIGRSFIDLTAFILYLNTDFADENGKNGTFQYENNFITYTNPEKYLTSEIMAILGQTLMVFKIGDGGSPLAFDRQYVAELPVGSDYIDGTLFLGKQILGVWQNNSQIEMTTDEMEQNPITGAITFDHGFGDVNLWFLVADIVPNGIEAAFDYSFENGGLTQS